MDYKTDIVLGEKYRDDQTGIEGTVIALTFFQYGCERATLEWEKDGGIHEASFDAPRLTRLSTGKKAESDDNGGPMKGSSHTRRGPSRR